MAPTDGADTTSSRPAAPLARRHVIALTIAGAGLAGAIGGVAAFGVAHTVSGDNTTLASSQGEVTTQTVEVPVPAQATLAPSTVTATPTPTESATASTSSDSGAPAPTSTRADSDGAPGDDTDEDAPDVLPERVLPTLTTTPDDDAAVRQAGNIDADDLGGSGTPTSTPDDERDDDSPDPTTTVPTDRDGDTGDGAGAAGTPQAGGPAPAPDNALLSDRAPLTPSRIDGAFRNALEPGVPAERRDELFEGGAAARPLTNRLASLSTGSVQLLHWSVHEPVHHDGDRATVRLRSDVLFNQAWRPVTFINVDGEWKLTRESTCELSKSLLLPCA